MASTPPSNTPLSIPKQGIFSTTNSLIPGSSCPSTSSLAGYSPNLSQGIGYSPSIPPASSGIPSFRSLRSLLSFGPNKNVTPVSISVSPNPSRSSFGGFGSVRRSMAKESERKVSLSNDVIVSVIAIERSNSDSFPGDTAISRSVPLSTLDKSLPSEPNEDSSIPDRSDLLPSAFTLRTPSPGPLLLTELSTIIEANNSGISKPTTVPLIPNPPARMRKRSMSVQERFGRGHIAGNEIGADLTRPRSSLSGRASHGSRAVFGPESGGSGGESSSVSGPKMEWSGAQTAKAFRAAGLLHFEGEKERGREEGSEPTRRLRGRSSSTSGVLSPSPLGIGNLASSLNRFASLRSASDNNSMYGRSHSRLTLSEAGTGGPGAPGRRGSEYFPVCGGASSYGGSGGGSSYGKNGLMESPTYTVSSGSGERDTPKSSISTAPTSLAESFGYLGRDRSERDLNRERERDGEREEIHEMKEQHGVEMGALLGALSDSQRTVRKLREENSDLRDRLERLTLAVQATEELRQACGNLQSSCSNLRRENTDLRRELVGLKALKSSNGPTHSWSSNNSGLRTPIPKTASGSPLARNFTPRATEYDATFIDHGIEVEDHPHYPSSNDPGYVHEYALLLHEDATFTLGSIGGSKSSTNHSQYSFSSLPAATSSNSSQQKTHVRSLSQSSPISYRNFAANVPNTSFGSISPTTANFSMVTGSPGSLFLRPEHEILLGDMESLDLGMQGGDGEVADGYVDAW